MYIVYHSSIVNGLYIKLTDEVTPEEVPQAVLHIKNIVRKNLQPGFTSVVDLTDVTIDRLKEHFTEIRQALIVLSIYGIGKIIRIGSDDVLKHFSKIYDEYYAYKPDAPHISTCKSVEDCLASNPELDDWFRTLLDNIVVLD